jgi:uncharacterized membrane protein
MPRPQNSYHHQESVDQITAQNVRCIGDLERAAQKLDTVSDRLAAQITKFCGSMPFVWMHLVVFTGWLLANTIILPNPVDPFPFSFLTLVVSLEAIFLSSFILIAGNRQARVQERRSQLDLQINLLAEQESTKTLYLLRAIAGKLEIEDDEDPDVAVLERATRPERLVEQIEAIDAEIDRPDTASAPAQGPG